MIPGAKNTLRAEMKKGRKVSAAWLNACSNLTAEAIAQAGIEVLVVDMEHSPGDLLTLVGQIQAMQGYPAVPFVRAPWNDFVVIKRILDAGAYGIFVPYVNNRAEAEAAVAAVVYPPAGVRGMAGSPRAAHYGQNPKEYFNRANDEISVWVLAESREAVANLDDILKVERLDGIVIGPMDLATNMGHFANPAATEVVSAIREIEEKTLKAGKLLCTIAGSWEDAAEKYRRGYSLIMAMSDTATLAQAARNLADSFKRDFA